MKRSNLIIGLMAAVSFAGPSLAGPEITVFTGIQESPHSIVTGEDETLGSLDFTAGWEGRSMSPPPYYGARITWWGQGKFGWGFELTHDKIYANDETLANAGFRRLEFTDGLNIITVNGLWRGQARASGLLPYGGVGAGVAIPHVDIEPEGGPHTWEYQLTGPAVRWFAGVRYDLKGDWDLIGEYQGTYSLNDVRLDDGGHFSTNIVTNALNIGVTKDF